MNEVEQAYVQGLEKAAARGDYLAQASQELRANDPHNFYANKYRDSFLDPTRSRFQFGDPEYHLARSTASDRLASKLPGEGMNRAIDMPRDVFARGVQRMGRNAVTGKYPSAVLHTSLEAPHRGFAQARSSDLGYLARNVRNAARDTRVPGFVPRTDPALANTGKNVARGAGGLAATAAATKGLSGMPAAALLAGKAGLGAAGAGLAGVAAAGGVGYGGGRLLDNATGGRLSDAGSRALLPLMNRIYAGNK